MGSRSAGYGANLGDGAAHCNVPYRENTASAEQKHSGDAASSQIRLRFLDIITVDSMEMCN